MAFLARRSYWFLNWSIRRLIYIDFALMRQGKKSTTLLTTIDFLANIQNDLAHF